jgi:hypothetical protein
VSLQWTDVADGWLVARDGVAIAITSHPTFTQEVGRGSGRANYLVCRVADPDVCGEQTVTW